MICKLNINPIMQRKNISQITFKKSKKLNRVKLNYMPAVSHTKPVSKITISSGHLEALDREIKIKCEQNARNYIAGELKAKRLIVR